MVLRLLAVIQAATPTLAPTAACTLAASGSGATIPTGTYYVVSSESNGIGSTLVGPVSASQAVNLGQNLVVTFPALQSGNLSRKTFIGTASIGPFLQVGEGTTASTLTVSSLPGPGAGGSSYIAPDAANKTQPSTSKISAIRAALSGNLQPVYRNVSNSIDNFNHGDAVMFDIIQSKVTDAALAFMILAQVCNEAGALIDANPGSIVNVPPNSVMTATPTRVWP